MPLYRFSHQCGHIMAALYSSGSEHLLGAPFYAAHVSGGTTELLSVSAEGAGFRCELIGGTKDEFSCTEMVERELAQKEEYARQAATVDGIMRENAALKAQVEFLMDEVKAWRKACTGV